MDKDPPRSNPLHSVNKPMIPIEKMSIGMSPVKDKGGKRSSDLFVIHMTNQAAKVAKESNRKDSVAI